MHFSFPSHLKKTTVVVESLSNNTTKCTVPENTSLLQDLINSMRNLHQISWRNMFYTNVYILYFWFTFAIDGDVECFDLVCSSLHKYLHETFHSNSLTVMFQIQINTRNSLTECPYINISSFHQFNHARLMEIRQPKHGINTDCPHLPWHLNS